MTIIAAVSASRIDARVRATAALRNKVDASIRQRSRGEWGYIRPIIRRCQARGIGYSICATNMVLLPGTASSSTRSSATASTFGDEIFMSLEGNNHFTMAKSLAVFIELVRRRPSPHQADLGRDRGRSREQLMAAVAAAYTYTPVAHVAGRRAVRPTSTA